MPGVGRVIQISLLLLGATGASFAPSIAQTQGTPKLVVSNASYRELLKGVLVETNIRRAEQGLPPLKMNAVLSRAAQWMAEDMAHKNYFSHTDSQGRTIGTRLPAFGYDRYEIIRENLAGGQIDPKEVVDAWMKSPGHRESILCDTSTEIGIGYYYYPNSKYKIYWVQEFGKPLDQFAGGRP